MHNRKCLNNCQQVITEHLSIIQLDLLFSDNGKKVPASLGNGNGRICSFLRSCNFNYAIKFTLAPLSKFNLRVLASIKGLHCNEVNVQCKIIMWWAELKGLWKAICGIFSMQSLEDRAEMISYCDGILFVLCTKLIMPFLVCTWKVYLFLLQLLYLI